MTTQATTTIAQITQLPNLPMENLWALWEELFDRRPGHHQRTYLESRIAYKLQERTFGRTSKGCSPSRRGRLRRSIKADSTMVQPAHMA